MFKRILRALGLGRRAKLDVNADNITIHAKSVTFTDLPRREVVDELRNARPYTRPSRVADVNTWPIVESPPKKETLSREVIIDSDPPIALADLVAAVRRLERDAA